MGRRAWEKKWRNPGDGFGWKLGEVAAEVRDAFEAGWLTKGMTILDLGCGAGENAAWLAHRCDVTAIDISKTAIAEAND
jgi:cyclopropane fatty-acyl-phospholipid synthase-like methyltransferase